jgi:hypothetical protein
MTPRTAATWDDFACDGQKCSCHDPFLCSDCGCLHNEAETSRIDVERLARALNATIGQRGWLRATPSSPVEEWIENAAAIAKAYEEQK